MAGVSTKEIKNRIRSMESTRQITKAMEMVAASKLRRAQAQVLSSRPYFEILYSTIADIASSNRDFSSPYLQERPVKKHCISSLPVTAVLPAATTATFSSWFSRRSLARTP